MPESQSPVPVPAGLDPSKPGIVHDVMSEDLRLVNTLMGGTKAMREAGKLYLPQEPKETSTLYNNRLRRSFLFNAFKKTIGDLVGRPFSKVVGLSDDSSQEFVDMEPNVDQAGRTLNAFGRDLFTYGTIDGMAHVLVDYPRTDGTLTLAEERQQGVKPFFVLIKSTDLIYFESARIGGAEVLTRIRFNEHSVGALPNGGQEIVRKIREYALTDAGAEWKLYAPSEISAASNNKTSSWVIEGSGPVTIGKIPLVTFYTNREGFMYASPPLMPLAELNLQHWQETSDQNNILHVARVPMLFGAGFEKSELASAVIGASSAIRSSNAAAQLRYVEHTGAAIGAGRQSIST